MQHACRYLQFFTIGLILTSAASACAQPFTPEQNAALDAAIAELDAQIATAEQESALYAGGLVKTLVELRLATLRQTGAILNQRKQADTYGITVTYTVDGSTFSPGTGDQIAALEAEIAVLEKNIIAQQAEADRYAGGLVQAMALSTVATSRQSLVMLQQQRLALTYGLPQYVGAASAEASSVPATAPAAAPDEASSVEIVSIDARVTESNSTWSRFAWILKIRNSSNQPRQFNATIEFQDADGFVIDTDDEYGLVVAAEGDVPVAVEI